MQKNQQLVSKFDLRIPHNKQRSQGDYNAELGGVTESFHSPQAKTPARALVDRTKVLAADVPKDFSEKQQGFEIKAIQSKIYAHDEKIKQVIKKPKRGQKSPIRIPVNLSIVKVEYGGPNALNVTANSFKSSAKPASSFHNSRNAGWQNSNSPNNTFYENEALKLSPSSKNIQKLDNNPQLLVQSQQKTIINKDILQSLINEKVQRKQNLGQVDESLNDGTITKKKDQSQKGGTNVTFVSVESEGAEYVMEDEQPKTEEQSPAQQRLKHKTSKLESSKLESSKLERSSKTKKQPGGSTQMENAPDNQSASRSSLTSRDNNIPSIMNSTNNSKMGTFDRQQGAKTIAQRTPNKDDKLLLQKLQRQRDTPPPEQVKKFDLDGTVKNHLGGSSTDLANTLGRNHLQKQQKGSDLNQRESIQSSSNLPKDHLSKNKKNAKLGQSTNFNSTKKNSQSALNNSSEQKYQNISQIINDRTSQLSNPLDQIQDLEVNQQPLMKSPKISFVKLPKEQLKQSQFEFFGVQPTTVKPLADNSALMKINEQSNSRLSNSYSPLIIQQPVQQMARHTLQADDSVQQINTSPDDPNKQFNNLGTQIDPSLDQTMNLSPAASNNQKPFMFGFGSDQGQHRLQISTTISKGGKHKFDMNGIKRSPRLPKQQRLQKLKEHYKRNFQMKAAIGPSVINKALPFRMSHYDFNDRSIEQDPSQLVNCVASTSNLHTSQSDIDEGESTGTKNVFIRLNQPSEGSLAKLFNSNNFKLIGNHGISASVNLKSKKSMRQVTKFNNNSKTNWDFTLPELSLDTSINVLNRVNKISQSRDNGIKIIENNGIQMQSNRNFFNRELSAISSMQQSCNMENGNQLDMRLSQNLSSFRDFNKSAQPQIHSLLPFNSSSPKYSKSRKTNISSSLRASLDSDLNVQVENEQYLNQLKQQQQQNSLIRQRQKYLQNLKLYQPPNVIQDKYKKSKNSLHKIMQKKYKTIQTSGERVKDEFQKFQLAFESIQQSPQNLIPFQSNNPDLEMTEHEIDPNSIQQVPQEQPIMKNKYGSNESVSSLKLNKNTTENFDFGQHEELLYEDSFDEQGVNSPGNAAKKFEKEFKFWYKNNYAKNSQFKTIDLKKILKDKTTMEQFKKYKMFNKSMRSNIPLNQNKFMSPESFDSPSKSPSSNIYDSPNMKSKLKSGQNLTFISSAQVNSPLNFQPSFDKITTKPKIVNTNKNEKPSMIIDKTRKHKETDLKLDQIMKNQQNMNTLSGNHFVSAPTSRNVLEKQTDSQHYEMIQGKIDENPSASKGETLAELQSSLLQSQIIKTATVSPAKDIELVSKESPSSNKNDPSIKTKNESVVDDGQILKQETENINLQGVQSSTQKNFMPQNDLKSPQIPTSQLETIQPGKSPKANVDAQSDVELNKTGIEFGKTSYVNAEKKSLHTIDKVSISQSVDTSRSFRPTSKKKVGKVKHISKIMLASGRESLVANDYAIKEENQVTITSKERLIEPYSPYSPIFQQPLGKTGTMLPQINVVNQSYDGITSGVIDPSMMMPMQNYNMANKFNNSMKAKKLTSRETKMSFQKKLVKQGPLAFRGQYIDFDDEIDNQIFLGSKKSTIERRTEEQLKEQINHIKNERMTFENQERDELVISNLPLVKPSREKIFQVANRATFYDGQNRSPSDKHTFYNHQVKTKATLNQKRIRGKPMNYKTLRLTSQLNYSTLGSQGGNMRYMQKSPQISHITLAEEIDSALHQDKNSPGNNMDYNNEIMNHTILGNTQQQWAESAGLSSANQQMQN